MVKDELNLIKLGGAAITDKDQDSTMRFEVVNNALKDISQSQTKSIIIHGAGSFAHGLAKKYKVGDGRDDSLSYDKQLAGLSIIRYSMQKMNNMILDIAIECGLKPFTVPVSAIFISEGPELMKSTFMDQLDHILDKGMIPVLYGDVSFDTKTEFRVISGDRIITELVRKFQNQDYAVNVIFGTNVDGLYDRNPSHPEAKLIQKLNLDDIGAQIKSTGQSSSVDITGGMKGKLEEIKVILELGVPVTIVNLVKKGRLHDVLHDRETICTKAHP